MAYLLDTNIFIQAKNFYYGFDFCPAFWEWLAINNAEKRVFSIEKVGDEIKAGSDPLADWASKLDSNFFLKPNAAILPKLGEVSKWATSQNYEPAAINTFLQGADYYLIAHALAHGYIVVTHEQPTNSLRFIKIPNVCIGLGVQYKTPFEMLRIEQARFILGPQAS